MIRVTFHYLEQDLVWGPHDMSVVPSKDDFVHLPDPESLDDSMWWVSRAHYKPDTNEVTVIVTPAP